MHSHSCFVFKSIPNPDIAVPYNKWKENIKSHHHGLITIIDNTILYASRIIARFRQKSLRRNTVVYV